MNGPIAILCEEIGYRFHRRLETAELLIEYTRVLVGHVDQMRAMQVSIAAISTRGSPSFASGDVLTTVEKMLAADVGSIVLEAAKAHDFIHSVHDDEAIPTDHLIDMLSSCVSAVRFGLEMPCHSRHAAEAASHIWAQKYGISLFDDCTPAWQHDWARQQLDTARLVLSAKTGRPI